MPPSKNKINKSLFSAMYLLKKTKTAGYCDEIIKSHIKQYMKEDGTVVSEHDDKRLKKHPDITAHENRHGDKIHTGSDLKHGNELMEHLKQRGWKQKETSAVSKTEKTAGKKEDMPKPPEALPHIPANDTEVPGALRTMKRIYEEASASDDPIATIMAFKTSRGNTVLKAKDEYRKKLLEHFGYEANDNEKHQRFEKDGHTITISKDGNKHKVEFAGGDADDKRNKPVGSITGKKEVTTVDTGKKNPVFVMGKENKSYTAKMNPVHSKYALVEAKHLTASHTITGHVNRAYPQEIQPRERERLSSQMQMANMMNDIKPELFGAGNMAAHGAPIVGKDGAVESGNGRTIALTEAYNRGLANHYKDYLKTEAEQFGLKPEDVDGMEQPVLVRVRNDDDPNTDRAEFAREANDTGNLGSSPAEQAWNDAERIDDNLIKKFTVDEDGEIYNEDNMEFIKGFLGKLGKNEAAGLLDSDGDPNKKCIERIQNAMFAKVYGSSVLTEFQAESAKPRIRNVLKALNSCVSDFAQVRGHDDLDVVPDMMEAIEYTLAHKDESKAELEYKLRNSGALDFTGDTPTFKTEHAVNMILAIADRSGSRNRLENVFRSISNEIKNEVASRENPEVDMFSGPAQPKSKEQVVKQALDKVNRQSDDTQKSLHAPVLYLLRKSIGGTHGRKAEVRNDRRREVPAQSDNARQGTGSSRRNGQEGLREGRLRKSKAEEGEGGKEGAEGRGQDSSKEGCRAGAWLIRKSYKPHSNNYYQYKNRYGKEVEVKEKNWHPHRLGLNIHRTGNSPTDYVTVNGKRDLAMLPQIHGEDAPLYPPAPIRLNIGEHRGFQNGYGIEHIKIDHHKEIMASGLSPEEYVCTLLHNVSKVRSTGEKRLHLVCTGSPSGIVLVELRKEKGGFYSIVSAGEQPIRGKIVWSGRIASAMSFPAPDLLKKAASTFCQSARQSPPTDHEQVQLAEARSRNLGNQTESNISNPKNDVNKSLRSGHCLLKSLLAGHQTVDFRHVLQPSRLCMVRESADMASKATFHNTIQKSDLPSARVKTQAKNDRASRIHRAAEHYIQCETTAERRTQ